MLKSESLVNNSKCDQKQYQSLTSNLVIVYSCDPESNLESNPSLYKFISVQFSYTVTKHVHDRHHFRHQDCQERKHGCCSGGTIILRTSPDLGTRNFVPNLHGEFYTLSRHFRHARN